MGSCFTSVQFNQMRAKTRKSRLGTTITNHVAKANVVIFDVSGAGLTGSGFSAGLRERGVLANNVNDREMRMVTHYDASRTQCLQALDAVRDLCRA
jgi:threonine aldolase